MASINSSYGTFGKIPNGVNDANCSICLEPLRNREVWYCPNIKSKISEEVYTAPLDHALHQECVQDFWKNKFVCRCPNCNYTLPEQENRMNQAPNIQLRPRQPVRIEPQQPMQAPQQPAADRAVGGVQQSKELSFLGHFIVALLLIIFCVPVIAYVIYKSCRDEEF